MPIFIEREHLHRNVTRGRILLEMVENRPAKHVGQEHIERDCRRIVLVRQRQSLCSVGGDQDFESFVARKIAEYSGIVRIIFDDKQYRVAVYKICAIVLDADLLLDCRDRG